MTLNAADRKSIRAAEKASARAERERGEVLIALASTGPGRRYLWDQLEAAHLFSAPYPTDPYQAYFILGQRNEGQRLLDELIRWCPDQFLQLLREANGRRTSPDTSPDRAAGEPTRSEDGDWGDQEPAISAAGYEGQSYN